MRCARLIIITGMGKIPVLWVIYLTWLTNYVIGLQFVSYLILHYDQKTVCSIRCVTDDRDVPCESKCFLLLLHDHKSVGVLANCQHNKSWMIRSTATSNPTSLAGSPSAASSFLLSLTWILFPSIMAISSCIITNMSLVYYYFERSAQWYFGTVAPLTYPWNVDVADSGKEATSASERHPVVSIPRVSQDINLHFVL